MDPFNLILFVAAVSYFGITIYMANVAQVTGNHATLVRLLLYGVIGMVFLNALTTLQVAYFPPMDLPDVQIPSIDPNSAAINFVFSLAACVFSAVVASAPSGRTVLKSIFRGGAYNPESPVHTTAIVLSLALVTFTVGQLVLSGGLSGLAESVESDGISISSSVLNEVLWIIMSVLGVGLFLRRTGQQTVSRLGLRFPTRADVRAGVTAGLLLYGLVIVLSLVWASSISPEQFEEQNAAAEQIAALFNTLPLALLLAVASSVGEEVLFRGALQPVFGLWVTSIFFAVLHAQYTLTPASLIIFVVGLALGWVRQRHSTTASIIGHFTYNFVLLALPLLFGSMAGV